MDTVSKRSKSDAPPGQIAEQCPAQTNLLYAGEVSGELLQALYTKPARLTLCSEGGNLYDMFAAIDFLEANPTEIVATGVCLSAAVPVLACGSRRFVTPRCRLLVHLPFQDGSPGKQKAIELAQDAAELERLREAYCVILGQRTRKKAAWWARALVQEDWMTAKDAVRLGVADAIL